MIKALGIIRKTDELGRIVIPKEIRSIYGIKAGTPMEMLVNDQGDLIFKRYFPISNEIIDKINATGQQSIDKDEVINIIKNTIGEL